MGIADDTGTERLGSGNITHDGIINNPGGLAGVWAVENSRDAIFEALRRRETFATSGPRIYPTILWRMELLPDAFCGNPDRIAADMQMASPWVGSRECPSWAGSNLFVSALRDMAPQGAPVQEIEIIKGWLTSTGETKVKVYSVAGRPAMADTLVAGVGIRRLWAPASCAACGKTQTLIPPSALSTTLGSSPHQPVAGALLNV